MHGDLMEPLPGNELVGGVSASVELIDGEDGGLLRLDGSKPDSLGGESSRGDSCEQQETTRVGHGVITCADARACVPAACFSAGPTIAMLLAGIVGGPG
jgi:hypothetical protein